MVSVSGRKALCVGARHSLCRAPTLCVGAQRSLCQGPALLCVWHQRSRARRSLCGGPARFSTLCVGARRSVSGPGAVCVGPRRCPALSVRVGIGARRSFSAQCLCRVSSRPGSLSLCRAPHLCVGACQSSSPLSVSRRSLSGSVSRPGGPFQALFVSGPGALCVGALCVGARRALCRGPALFASRPGAPCVGTRRFGFSPKTLFVRSRRSVSGPLLALFVSGPGALCRGAALFVPCTLCVRARLPLCRGPALSVGGRRRPLPHSLCQVPAPRRFLSRLSGLGGLSVEAQRSVCWARRSLCRHPALFVRRGDRRSLFRAPALFLSGPALFLSGAGALCQGVCGAPAVSVSELGDLQRSLCRGPALSGRSLCVGICVVPGVSVGVCGRLRRSPRRRPALSVGPGAVCRALAPFVLSGPVPGPDTQIVGPRHTARRALTKRPPSADRLDRKRRCPTHRPPRLPKKESAGPDTTPTQGAPGTDTERRAPTQRALRHRPLTESGVCVEPGRLLCRSSIGALERSPCRGPALSGGNVCVGDRRSCQSLSASVCRAPALFVSGRCSSRRGPAPCVGARRSVSGSASGPGGPLPRLSWSGPVSPRFLSGPGALYVRAQRSVCRGPALFASGPCHSDARATEVRCAPAPRTPRSSTANLIGAVGPPIQHCGRHPSHSALRSRPIYPA